MLQFLHYSFRLDDDDYNNRSDVVGTVLCYLLYLVYLLLLPILNQSHVGYASYHHLDHGLDNQSSYDCRDDDDDDRRRLVDGNLGRIGPWAAATDCGYGCHCRTLHCYCNEDDDGHGRGHTADNRRHDCRDDGDVDDGHNNLSAAAAAIDD